MALDFWSWAFHLYLRPDLHIQATIDSQRPKTQSQRPKTIRHHLTLNRLSGISPDAIVTNKASVAAFRLILTISCSRMSSISRIQAAAFTGSIFRLISSRSLYRSSLTNSSRSDPRDNIHASRISVSNTSKRSSNSSLYCASFSCSDDRRSCARLFVTTSASNTTSIALRCDVNVSTSPDNAREMLPPAARARNRADDASANLLVVRWLSISAGVSGENLIA